MTDPILLAAHGETACHLLPALANRHGLITGATGTGKTISLQKLAESFSAIGVPVFMADVKGDLTGISGDLSGVSGDLTGIRGNLDACEITLAERAAGVNVADLIG